MPSLASLAYERPFAGFAPAHRQVQQGVSQRQGDRALEAVFRLRSARGWILRLAALSQGLSLASTSPRSCGLPPGQALGPSARVTGVCPEGLQKIYGGTFLAFGRGIVAATRIPLHVSKTLETHPLTGAGQEYLYSHQCGKSTAAVSDSVSSEQKSCVKCE